MNSNDGDAGLDGRHPGSHLWTSAAGENLPDLSRSRLPAQLDQDPGQNDDCAMVLVEVDVLVDVLVLVVVVMLVLVDVLVEVVEVLINRRNADPKRFGFSRCDRTGHRPDHKR